TLTRLSKAFDVLDSTTIAVVADTQSAVLVPSTAAALILDSSSLFHVGLGASVQVDAIVDAWSEPLVHRSPQAAPAPSGWLVTWQQGASADLRARLLDESGSPTGSEQALGKLGSERMFGLSRGPEGWLLLTDSTTDDYFPKVGKWFLASVDSLPVPLGDVGMTDASQVAVVASTEGWLIAWSQAFTNDVYATRLEPDGTLRDNTLVVRSSALLGATRQADSYQVFFRSVAHESEHPAADAMRRAIPIKGPIDNPGSFPVFPTPSRQWSLAASSTDAWWVASQDASGKVIFHSETSASEVAGVQLLGLVSANGAALAMLRGHDAPNALILSAAEPGGELEQLATLEDVAAADLSDAVADHALLAFIRPELLDWGAPTPRLFTSVVTLGRPTDPIPAAGGQPATEPETGGQPAIGGQPETGGQPATAGPATEPEVGGTPASDPVTAGEGGSTGQTASMAPSARGDATAPDSGCSCRTSSRGNGARFAWLLSALALAAARRRKVTARA
ncbi:MAG TPA: MYXO-CTERM sorting domain-containing protein, partial [Polyangiaceae bacterium]|nr:MYXO-CTERM sorting domain-containing protein [Polyangiaceae bacterium]